MIHEQYFTEIFQTDASTVQRRKIQKQSISLQTAEDADLDREPKT